MGQLFNYHDDEGYLIIRAKLPAEQGAVVVKAIEAARDMLWQEHKNVSAETPSGFQAESHVEPRADEPYGAERADALCLMAETFQAGLGFIGRIEKGFDFLGYHFSRAGFSIAASAIERFVKRATRLYEQEQHGSDGTPLLGRYVRRWMGWALGGLGEKIETPRTEAGLMNLLGNMDGLLCLSPVEANTG